MATLAEIRQKHPEYNDMSDGQLADGLYKKFYSDMPRDQFDTKVGLTAPATPAPQAPAAPERGSIADPLIQGATFGFGDEIAGGVGGVLSTLEGKGFKSGYERTRDLKRRDLASYQERHPVISTGAEIAGSLPTAMIPLGAAAKGASLAGKVFRGAAAGATSGALYGAGQGEGAQDRLRGAAQGAVIGGTTGGAIPFAGKAVAKVVGARSGAAAVPTAQAMKDEAQGLYKLAKQSGVGIKPQSFADAVDNILEKAKEAGINPKQQPKAFENFRILVKARDAGDRGLKINLSDMETLRQIAGNVLKDADPNERRVTHVLVDGIDDFMSSLKPNDVIGGKDATAAVKMVQTARQLWSRKSKADIIERAFERAKNGAANHTNAGMETALRQQFRQIANNERAFRRFSKEERTAILQVVRGSNGQSVLRFFGKFAPTGFFSGAGTLGAGAALGVVPAAAMAGAGFAAKAGATKLIKNAAKRADVMVRNGGKLPFDEQAARLADQRANKLFGVGGRVIVPQLTK